MRILVFQVDWACRLLRLRHVVDVVPALGAVAEVAASRTDLDSFILRLTLQVSPVPACTL